MDPHCEAALAAFREGEEAFREVLAGLPDGALNWQPGPGTNSIAVLVEHAWGAARAWTARAAGREVERDRAAEFRVTRSASELADLLAHGLAQIEEHLAAVDPTRYGERSLPPGTQPPASARDVTRAWCLLHAVEHAREHLGQAQLTRQLWQQQSPPPAPMPLL
jgi:uncharacterized damage-inducible protein DinB